MRKKVILLLVAIKVVLLAIFFTPTAYSLWRMRQLSKLSPRGKFDRPFYE